MQTTGQQIYVKNVNIGDIHYHIQNHYEKCIQISTNMYLVIPEITCEMLELWENTILLSKTNAPA